MKTENGKIIEATTKELFDLWLNDGWSEQVSFPDFLYYMERAGTTIKEDGDDSANQRQDH